MNDRDPENILRGSLNGDKNEHTRINNVTSPSSLYPNNATNYTTRYDTDELKAVRERSRRQRIVKYISGSPNR